MSKTFNLNITRRARKARSERLRQAGQGGGTTSGGSTVVSVTGGGAAACSCDGHTHANKGDLDKISLDTDRYAYATQMENVEQADGSTSYQQNTEKIKAGYADEAGELSPDSPTRDDFLSAKENDTAEGVITFQQGAAFEGAATFGTDGRQIDPDGNAELGDVEADGDLSVSGGASVGGDAAIGGDLSVSGDQTDAGDLEVKGDTTLRGTVQSGEDYTETQVGTWGVDYVPYGGTEQTEMAIDRLYVRMKAIFEELEIRRLSYTGGNRVASPAGSKVTAVEELDADGLLIGTAALCDASGATLTDASGATLTAPTAEADAQETASYRLWLKADDGDTATQNGWAQYDLCACKEFNTTAAHGHTATRGYVRLVLAAGEAEYDSEGNCTAQAYIIVGNGEGQKDTDADAPQAGDVIVQMGNTTDTDRDQYIVERTNGQTAPSYEMYADVNDLADIGAEANRTAIISPKKVEFTTKFFKLKDYDGTKRELIIDRGEWSETDTYYYNNRVSHGGDLWVLKGVLDKSAGVSGAATEPKDGGTYWERQTESGTGPQGDPGKDGADGQSSFKSTAFKRAASQPATPTGGSYASPVPTTTGWSDGIPAEDGNPCYMSTRIFTSDGKTPQESAWTAPVLCADTADMDFCFNASETEPDAPAADEHPSQTSGGWHDTATEADIWMAISKKSNGVWGDWEVSKIKGEQGDPGKDGADGKAGITLYYSNNPMELATADSGQVEDGETACEITYTGAGQTQKTAVTNIQITALSGVTSGGATADGNEIAISGHYVETEAVTWEDTDGESHTQNVSVASGYVDFTCKCGDVTGVPGRLVFKVSQQALWKSVTWSKAEYKSLYGALYGEDGSLAALETKISQNASEIELKAAKTDLTTEINDRKSADEATLSSAQTYAKKVADAAVADVETEVATLTSSVSELSVEADRIAAKTKAYVGVNILTTDADGLQDSTEWEGKVAAISSTATFYLRKGITKGCTYRFHAEVYVKAKEGASATSATGAGFTLKKGSVALASISALGTSSGVSLAAGLTIGNADFTAAADYAAGTALTINYIFPTSTGVEAVHVQDVALLYDMEQFMLDTGFDIFGHTFEVTADNFLVRNNSGLRTLSLDDEGNLVVRGTVNNETLVIDSRNEDSYLLDCPETISNTSGTIEVVTRSGTDYAAGGQSCGDYCLDLLRCPTVVALGTLPTVGNTGFFLPMAWGDEDDGNESVEYIRTKTKYQSSAARWMTFEDMKAMLGRKWKLINNGKRLTVGCGTYFYRIAANGEYSSSATALPLESGRTLTFELVGYNGGYKWMVEGGVDYHEFATAQTIERVFASLESNWNLPVGTALHNSAYLAYTAGTANGTAAAGRTFYSLSGSTYASGTALFSRYTGGSLATGSSKYFALLSASTATAGVPITTGASRVVIRLRGGYYADSADATTWRYLGVRVMLWRKASSTDTALAEYAQTARLNADGNGDLLELDLEQVFTGWTETSACYLALNVEGYTGSRVGDTAADVSAITLADIEPQVLCY